MTHENKIVLNKPILVKFDLEIDTNKEENKDAFPPFSWRVLSFKIYETAREWYSIVNDLKSLGTSRGTSGKGYDNSRFCFGIHGEPRTTELGLERFTFQNYDDVAEYMEETSDPKAIETARAFLNWVQKDKTTPTDPDSYNSDVHNPIFQCLEDMI